MKRRVCLLLVAVLSVTVAQRPSWTYYSNGAPPPSASNSVPWRPVPPEAPPAYQPYSTIDPAEYSRQASSSQGYPATSSAPAPAASFAPAPAAGYAPAPAAPQQPATQYRYPAPQENRGQVVDLGVRGLPAGFSAFQPSSAVPLPFGGMQSFYFSPKERALYQVMKITLNPAQFNMIQDAMDKYSSEGQQVSSPQQGGSGGYDQPAAYGPPSTTTTEAPEQQEEIDSSALTNLDSLRDNRPAYGNRPKFNITFSLRTWDGEECEFLSEPEPNEGKNPRLRALPVRTKRGLMKCHPVSKKHGHGSKAPAPSRTVSDDDKNPLQPFRAPASTRPLLTQQVQNLDDGLAAVFSIANAQEPQRGSSRNFAAPGRGQSQSQSQQSAQQSAPQDSYLPPQAAPSSGYGPPNNQYGPPKPKYGPPPPEELEFDESGTSSANVERGTLGGGADATQTATVDLG